MKPVTLALVLATLVLATPAALASETSVPACSPVLEAYACPWGSTGVQQATVCGKEMGSACVPIL
jgi:hypothetical protein